MNEENKAITPVEVTPKELAEFCVDAADSKKAEQIVCLDIGKITFIADYLIVCTGNSTTQLSAIQSSVVRGAREKFGIRPLSTEGESISGWILVDFGTVLVHVMNQDKRDLYQLEKLWGDAPSTEDRQMLEMMRPSK